MMKALALFLCAGTLMASQLIAVDIPLGETLETQMWENMKHHNWTAVEKNIAPDFRSVHWFGALDREKELELIKDLYLGNYKITALTTEEKGDTIIVTYLVAVNENIKDQRSTTKPTPRLSVWKKNGDSWQWIAHANCNPFDEAKAASKPKFAN